MLLLNVQMDIHLYTDMCYLFLLLLYVLGVTINKSDKLSKKVQNTLM